MIFVKSAISGYTSLYLIIHQVITFPFLRENRIGDLKKIKSKPKFVAFKIEEEITIVEDGSTIVKGYKRIDGIFLDKNGKILVYKDINDKKVKEIAIDDSLIVFKIQQE